MLVVTDRLTKSYGSQVALRECSLEVAEGEVFGLLGPNGSGKTTLLRILLGFLRPTAGRATIAGRDCYRDSVAVHRRLSYLPGEVRFPRRMKGSAVLAYFSRLRSDGDLGRARAIAARLQLDLSRQVARMSTGMRQMLALCVALSIDSPLVVLDEPTSNLDPTARAEVLSLVCGAARQGRTVIFSSHVLSEVEEACDRVAVLRGGSLVHAQELGPLLRQHRVQARLTGPIGPLPEALRAYVSLVTAIDGTLEIEVPGDMAPLLSWLSTQPLHEIRIERLGLRAIYDRFHGKQPDE